MNKGESPNDNNKELYLNIIRDLIAELDQAKGDIKEKNIILAQIKEADQKYLEAQGTPIIRHVLFTRHGLCSNNQKNYGLAPNSTVEESALQHMGKTDQSTSKLLSNAQAPTIVISPMIRALQTAAKIIPKNLQANLSIDPALSENTNAPSGSDIRSYDQLIQMRKDTSFFTSPLQKILFWLSTLFYSQSDFDNLKKKRDEAIDILAIAGHGITDESKNEDACRDVTLTGQQKIEKTNRLIHTAGNNDLWLIGHGKNFKAFFEATFGNESDFDYGETRSVYTIQSIKDNVSPGLFSPPYTLVVNQETGEIDGVYTGITKGVKVATSATPLPQEDYQGSLTTLGRGLGGKISPEGQPGNPLPQPNSVTMNGATNGNAMEPVSVEEGSRTDPGKIAIHVNVI
ncbi:histidine phosphatase family protein [Legionella lansingensis]|uniref:histidine phosphatase family protein n=1 Tax=Legionella lansingensis TaxID=45067 RepID=UPI0012B67BC4|nr:histidine phosphatase family protein [Legionella lansingensis]